MYIYIFFEILKLITLIVILQNGLHASHLTLKYNLNDNDVILDLQLNDKILPHTHYISYQLPNGEKAIRNFTKTDADLCHYHVSFRPLFLHF